MQITLGPFNCDFTFWRPGDGRVFDFFAFDTETTPIDDEHPGRTPDYVLGAACDRDRGVFVARGDVKPFFQAHKGARGHAQRCLRPARRGRIAQA